MITLWHFNLDYVMFSSTHVIILDPLRLLCSLVKSLVTFASKIMEVNKSGLPVTERNENTFGADLNLVF